MYQSCKCKTIHLSLKRTNATRISSWTRWIPTEPWRPSCPASAGASGSPWSQTDPGAGTAAEGEGPWPPPPWRPRRTTPQTDPTGWRCCRRPRRRTRSSPRGSTPPRWWERCVAWSWPRDARSTGTGEQWGVTAVHTVSAQWGFTLKTY